QLRALSEHGADPLRVLHAMLMRVESIHANLAGRRDEYAAQHLDRRRFAGSVRPDVSDGFAFFDRKIDSLDGMLVRIPLRKQMLHCAGQPRTLIRLPEYFSETPCLD